MQRTSPGRKRLRRGAVGALVVAVLLSGPAALAAPSLETGAADIAVQGDEVTVRVQYRLQNDDPKVTAIPLTVLRFAGTTIEDLRVRTAGGETISFDTEENGPALNVQVPVTQTGALDLVAEYRVHGAVSGNESGVRQLTVPILAPKWGPAGQGEVFEARLELPGEANFVEGFPVAPTAIESGEGKTTLVYRLPIAPAMIRAVVTAGAIPFWTLQRVLDVTVLLVLIAGAVVGYRVMMRRPEYVAERTAS